MKTRPPGSQGISSVMRRCGYIPNWNRLVALFAVSLIAVFAFGELFTIFVPWDDEGYFLQAYRQLLSGRVLYDQVTAPYGPLTFFIAAVVAGFNPKHVTPDNSRWIVLCVWIVIAACMSGVVWRWTRQFHIAILTFLSVGFRLKGLAKSIGHPQMWIVLAIAVLLLWGLDWVAKPLSRASPFRT